MKEVGDGYEYRMSTELDVVVYASNGTRGNRQEECEFKASLGYIARPSVKEK